LSILFTERSRDLVPKGLDQIRYDIALTRLHEGLYWHTWQELHTSQAGKLPFRDTIRWLKLPRCMSSCTVLVLRISAFSRRLIRSRVDVELFGNTGTAAH
jgi:hypothetical protein